MKAQVQLGPHVLTIAALVVGFVAQRSKGGIESELLLLAGSALLALPLLDLLRAPRLARLGLHGLVVIAALGAVIHAPPEGLGYAPLAAAGAWGARRLLARAFPVDAADPWVRGSAVLLGVGALTSLGSFGGRCLGLRVLELPLWPCAGALIAAALCAARSERAARSGARGFLGLSIAGAVCSGAGHVLAARARVGGIDFYYDVCDGRDLAWGLPRTSSATVQEHFPGIHRFWASVIALFGEETRVLQASLVAAILIHLLVVGVVLRRAGARAGWCGAAAVLLLAIDLPLELFEGTAERIATIPLSIGLALWGGRPFEGRAGLGRALALGVALGFAVLVKRQVGLMAAGGWTALVIDAALEPAPRSRRLVTLLVVPAAALVAFAAGFVAELGSLAPAVSGFGALARYEAEGSFVGNLAAVVGRSPGLALLVVPLGATIVRWARREGGAVSPGQRLAAFLGCASLATILQFTKRAYLHHALLVSLGAAVGAILVLEALWRARTAAVRAHPVVLAAGASALLSAIAFASGAPSGRLFGPASESPPPDLMAADLATLRPLVPRRSELLLVPPGFDRVHVELGTVSRSHPVGYSWSPEATKRLRREIQWAAFDRAVVVAEPVGFEREWAHHDGDGIVRDLAAHGFREAVRLRTLSLWVRDP